MSLGMKASADGTQITLQLGGVDLLTLSAAGVVAGPLASDAEAQGLSSLLKLLTPGKLNSAFQGANQSLAASGYQKLPGGLIIQWGITGSITTGTQAAITFPIAFPTSCRSVEIARITSTVSSTLSAWALNSVTVSGFNAINGTNETTAAYWLAIGY